MKFYPLSDSDIAEIGFNRGISAAAFSVGSGLLGFVVNQLLPAYSEGSLGQVHFQKLTVSIPLGIASTLYVVGAILWWRGHTKIGAVKSETVFPDG